MVLNNSYQDTDEFRYFLELTKIPRPSNHLSRISSFLIDFADRHGLEHTADAAGNIMIRRNGGSGKTIVLQGHTDIVGTSTDGTFDFENRPLDTYVRDGWIHARGTTLGGDDGGGLALMLCALTDPSLSSMDLECLFTANEEVGLIGTMNLDEKMVTGRTMINLDSECVDVITIGSAGSADISATFSYPFAADGGRGYSISIGGLRGGHSAGAIDQPRINAILFLIGFLKTVDNFRIGRIEGGSFPNVIPMRASVVFTAPPDADICRRFEEYCADRINLVDEPECSVSLNEVECTSTWSASDSRRFIDTLNRCPNGVLDRNERGIRLSSNLGVVRDSTTVVVKPRGSDMRALLELIAKTRAMFAEAGAVVPEAIPFPAWEESEDEPLVRSAARIYAKCFGKEPKILVTHAGLESSVIKDKCPGMQVISVGPNIRGAHSPDECMELSSLSDMKRYLFELIKDLSGQRV